MEVTKALKEYYKTFAHHGTGDAQVEMLPQEVALILSISYIDVYNKKRGIWKKEIKELSEKEYFSITNEDIYELPPMGVEEVLDYFSDAEALSINEFSMYFRKLCDLHRRRIKYREILRNQPFPTVEQIGPRTLLEYGNANKSLLYNWMSWRKWAYDVDNRSAQETGYLFEPILASCIGGESISHTRSPVKRLDQHGRPTAEGRQIDCFVKEQSVSYAYELKMRVTIAASGQGRFAEELIFPVEANAAGIKPVLIVFDSTESALLTKLTDAYLKSNGEVYIGENAWRHLKKEAGTLMGRFIEKYIEPPIKNMEDEGIEIPYEITLSADHRSILIKDNHDNKYVIKRL